jgi:hypothetical protein
MRTRPCWKIILLRDVSRVVWYRFTDNRHQGQWCFSKHISECPVFHHVFNTRRHRQKQWLYTLPNIWSRGIHFRAATLTLWPAGYAELLMVRGYGAQHTPTVIQQVTAAVHGQTGTLQTARLNTVGLRGPTQKTDFKIVLRDLIFWRRWGRMGHDAMAVTMRSYAVRRDAVKMCGGTEM